MRIAILTIALVAAPFAAHCLERTALGTSNQGEVALDIRRSTFEAAVTAALSDLKKSVNDVASALNDLSNKVTACGRRKTYYAGKGAAGADSSGCLAPDPQVPVGTLAAFEMTSCPKGWSPYTALMDRVPVGAGGSYHVGTNGGLNTIALTTANLPSFNFSYSDTYPYGGRKSESGNDREEHYIGTTTRQGTFHGSNVPFDNRQPFRALLYCRKS